MKIKKRTVSKHTRNMLINKEMYDFVIWITTSPTLHQRAGGVSSCNRKKSRDSTCYRINPKRAFLRFEAKMESSGISVRAAYYPGYVLAAGGAGC